MLKPAVYMLASAKKGVIYVGVSSDLIKRIFQHKNDEIAGFTKKYGCKILVYCEFYDSIIDAISREKQLKNWKRSWKIALIEKENKAWRDLYFDLL